MNKLDLLILVQGKERASIVFNFEGPALKWNVPTREGMGV